MTSTITHQKLLDRLAEKWVEMGGGRDTIAKCKLPKHAYECSPNFVVRALSDEEDANDVTAQFLLKHNKTPFNFPHTPSPLAWHLVTPSGETFFIFCWGNWQQNTASLFRAFCEESGRVFGTVSPDGGIDIKSRSISFFDCEIVHEEERNRQRRRVSKSESGHDPLATARKLLRRSADSCEDLEWINFRNDREAHDRELAVRVQQTFVRKLHLLRDQLSAKYGQPAKTGRTEHKLIPRNGILEYAIWERGGKSLFVAVSHEDVGLPFILLLGVTQ